MWSAVCKERGMETEMSFQGGAVMTLICINNRYFRSVLSTEKYI
jgi:hypothetical protein